MQRWEKKTIFLIIKMIINGLIGQEVGTAVLLVSHLGYAKGGENQKASAWFP